MCVPNLKPIHQVALKIFQSGRKIWNQPTSLLGMAKKSQSLNLFLQVEKLLKAGGSHTVLQYTFIMANT